MSYLELPAEVRMIYAVLCIITFTISVADFIRAWSSFKNKSAAIVPLVTAIANYTLFQAYGYSVDIRLDQFEPDTVYYLIEDMIYMPAAAYSLLLFGTLVVASVSYGVTTRKINSSITLRSIRDGFNSIDTGVLMYRKGGFLLLANTVMQEISIDLTGKRATNGEVFRTLLSSRGNKIVLSDGTVYLIKENELLINDKKINELTAVDVTLQTRLRKEIRELEEQKESFNRRLSDYSDKVGEVTTKKEILDTKIDVHESLGNALLLSKSYLKKDRSAPDKDTLKAMWHKVIIFKETAVVTGEDRFSKELYDAAKVCGINLNIEGTIPPKEEAHIRKILSTATREAIINASRHASADRMDLNIDTTDGYCFDFTNNGKAPDKITEGGGLSSLRQLVENNGGTMEVITSPQYGIIIRLPEKES